ncbi:MAG TPA: DUF3313 family protein [Rhizomicrobium sp.]|nr:DUF3313 family protein [Rhizomicrobium sp.]
MKRRSLTALFLTLVLLGTCVPAMVMAQESTWDDLNLVKSGRSQRLYLLPGANFQPYSKVLLDTTEVAFRKNWLRDYNQTNRSVSGRFSQDDVDRVSQQVSTSFGGILADEYQKAGYQVVQSPGPDVLRIRTGVIDLSVTAPEVRSASRTRTASWEAGEATLVVEARDSQSGALLGRALDRRLAGDTTSAPFMRNATRNKADFEILFRKWAKLSVEGLNRLKTGSPVASR